MGGCDTLAVEPFGFDAHLALNVQRILKEEAHLDAVADPAGGSYYIEALTDSLAREAWKLFQQVEAEGGYAEALASGPSRRRWRRRARRARRPYSSRRRTLVGVNNYPERDGEERRRRSRLPAAAGFHVPRASGWPSLSKTSGDARRGTRRAPAAVPRCCCSSAAI